MGPDAVLSAAAAFLSAEAAARRLGVSRATLYAYVSRGLLTAVPDPQDAHASRYSSFEIDLLVRRKGRRKGVEHAMAAISEGRPIRDTALACIHEGRPIYRGLSPGGATDGLEAHDRVWSGCSAARSRGSARCGADTADGRALHRRHRPHP